MRTNVKVERPVVYTHEGAQAVVVTPELALRRAVMACMLFESEFYESGIEIGARIADLCRLVQPSRIAQIAYDARTAGNLRHAPLWLLVALLKRTKDMEPAERWRVGETITQVIQRADEITELVSLYWKGNGGRRMLPAQLKRGLAGAFRKFDEYALAKYDRAAAVKLRDVLFLAHAEPVDEAQGALWKRLIDGTLATPDTWEVALSGGADKKETFERLIRERKLGYLALLRNLRNMAAAGCDLDLVNQAIVARKGGAERVLPFRYVAAARACPQLEPALDTALCAAIEEAPALKGRTVVLVDVSGSMDAALSAKSDMKCIDAAAALASIVKAEQLRVFTFSNYVMEVPPRRGMAGVDAVIRSQPHGGTMLGLAVGHAARIGYDRLIVVTDEQSHDKVDAPLNGAKAYMINVASAKNGVGYGNGWIHLDGFSESIIRYIAEAEAVG